MYRSMLACLVVVLQGLGMGMCKAHQPGQQQQVSSMLMSGGGGAEDPVKRCLRSPAALGDVLMGAMNCMQEEASQKVGHTHTHTYTHKQDKCSLLP